MHLPNLTSALKSVARRFRRATGCALALALATVAAAAQNLPDMGVQIADTAKDGASSRRGFEGSEGVRPASASLAGRRITRLVVELENGAPPDPNLQTSVPLREGEEFSAARLQGALVKLYELGLVSNAKAFVAEGPNGGVAVRLTLTLQVRVGGVAFAGTPVFQAEELRPRLANLEQGAKFSPRAVSEAIGTLREFYRERGYFQAQIDMMVTPPDANSRVSVVFMVLPGARATIGAWNVTGQLKISRAEIDAKAIKHPVGNVYSADLIQSDVQRIRALHLERNYLNPQISEPSVAHDPIANQVTLSVSVNSGPQVEVNLVGAELSRKERRRIFPILRDGGLDDFVLEDGARQLLTTLQKQGYFFATADYTRQTLPQEDRVVVTYTAEKNQRYRVGSVTIEGTDEVSYETLAPQLTTRPRSLIPPSRGLATQDSLSGDADVITRELRNLGYLRATVTEKRLAVTPNNANLNVTFHVEPGERATVAETTVVGNQMLPTDRLAQAIPDYGSHFGLITQARIRGDIDRLSALYGEEGYAQARIEYRIEELPDQPNRVKLIYEIAEGPKVTINRIVVNSSGLTSAGVLRRFLPFKEGDLLTRNRLNQAEQALYATGAFRQVLFQTPLVRQDGPNEALYDVTLDTIESQRFTTSYGFGFQSDDGGPRGSFEISNNNMFRRLEAASLILRGSPREQLVQLSYQFPQFRIPRFSAANETGVTSPLLVSGFIQRQRQGNNFDVRRATLLIQSERRLDAFTALLLRYRFQSVRTDVQQPTQRADQAVRLGGVSLTYLRDTRDSALDATRGAFISADASIASTGLGGDERFMRFLGQYQTFRPIVQKSNIVVAGRVQIGLARPYGGSQNVPLSERFFAGGSTTLRGLDFEQAGPRNPTTDRVEGGNGLVVATGELRAPLIKNLEGVAFYDTGNVFARVSDIKFRDFTNSVGGGLRIKTPLGPFRVDAAYLINPPSFVAVPDRRLPNFQIHFSFGQAF
jgi:outer membrane protein insertion porin family